MRLGLAPFAMMALAGAGAAAIAQDDVGQVIVYLECTLDDKTATGTGVLVGAAGEVLTAAHVVQGAGASCVGSPGVADHAAARRMIVQPSPALGVDVAMLQFSDQQEYPFVSFCALEGWMIRKSIFVAGYPGKTETGAPSYRQGVLSTVLPNSQGIIETDGQTVAGMSGGPVFTQDLKSLVGIVIGAKFDPSGLVTYVGILPVARYAQQFNLSKSEKPCFHRTREVSFEAGAGEWRAGEPAVPLGVRPEDGACFLATVTGQFNDREDDVKVSVENGEYVLGGQNHSGGQHGATARCIWYE